MKITIEGFENLTRQQMFDMAAAHIAKTRVQSFDYDKNRCCYGGSGCNASVFIKPEHKDKADEDSSSWKDLFEMGLVPTHEFAFIVDLQKAHDELQGGLYFCQDYVRRMKLLAEFYDLEYEEQLYPLTQSVKP